MPSNYMKSKNKSRSSIVRVWLRTLPKRLFIQDEKLSDLMAAKSPKSDIRNLEPSEMMKACVGMERDPCTQELLIALHRVQLFAL